MTLYEGLVLAGCMFGAGYKFGVENALTWIIWCLVGVITCLWEIKLILKNHFDWQRKHHESASSPACNDEEDNDEIAA